MDNSGRADLADSRDKTGSRVGWRDVRQWGRWIRAGIDAGREARLMRNRELRWGLVALAILGSRASAADPAPSITLGPRTACVTPQTVHQARADGGIVDVQLTAPNVLAANLTGTVAANAFLGCAGEVTQTFHLEQEFTVEGAGTGVREVTLTIESTLVGLVRARHKGSASARLASARVCPLGAPDSPLVVVHPCFAVGANGARLCNQRLAPIKVPAMPTGAYIFTADFVLAADAGGLADGHSAADFSPSTVLPADWVRARDPFQGVDKKDFGFHVTLTADPVAAGLQATAARTSPSPVVQTSATISGSAANHSIVKRAVLLGPVSLPKVP